MQQRPRIRLGFIGAGRMGQCAHLLHYARIADCEVVALAELRPKLRLKVARHYRIARTYSDHRELLAAEKLDGIVAIQPFQTHGSIVAGLLAAGVPVLIEKPLARSLAIAKSLAAAAQTAGVKLFVGYHKRSDPATIETCRQIECWMRSGEVGALRYIRLTMPPGDWQQGGLAAQLTTDEPRPQSEWDPGDGPLDNFLNYYAHQLNLLRHLLGEGYRVDHADPSGILLIARSDSGIPATIEMAPYSTPHDWQESAFICFDRAWIRLDLPPPLASDRAGRVQIFNGSTSSALAHPLPVPNVSAMRQQAVHFIRAIRGQATPLCEAAEAVADLEAAEEYQRLLRSARSVSPATRAA